ncbi:hypothetical protein VNO77_19694 [Canavalia gladiata]|uniref:Uncharacterized protein n=1 Tax=Canavalia gladiata TaxID=3824 RepID=A0AAN9QLN9_CANGL
MHVHTRGIKIVRGEIVLLLRMNPPSLLDFSILIRTVELASESLYNPNRIFSRNLDTAESQIMERGRKDAKDAKKKEESNEIYLPKPARDSCQTETKTEKIETLIVFIFQL